ncbi:MAG: flavin-containing monooxygenase [Gammaproteobacteria bacterium]
MGATSVQTDEVEVLVVGAGQAGLSVARELESLNVACVVHERGKRVGDLWRERFDSLVLFTPRELSALPGLSHGGDPQGFPSKDEMGDYLERYAERFALPVFTNNGVARLSRTPEGFVAVTASGKATIARAVVIATGGFQRPRRPPFACALSAGVQQLDPLSYRNPTALAEGQVIVVGDGVTGRQIALEIAQSRQVTLAMGRRRHFGPQTVFGKDTTGLALRTGLLTASKRTPAGRFVRWLDLTPGLHLRRRALRRAGIDLVPRCLDAEEDQLIFSDGSHRHADVLIWALGYRDDTRWVEIEGATMANAFVHEDGVTKVPGLYHVGREWQVSRASGLICGVARDAAIIAAQVKQFVMQRR